MKLYKYFLIAFSVILIDQISKMWVYNTMDLHSEINVLGDWFKIHYLLNPGMAFGIKWNSEYGKLALTIFRLIAAVGISYYIISLFKNKAKAGLIICMSLILGGAIGNVIDSTFYGVLLDNAPADSPSPWFHGQVIDMLYFPMFEGYWPEWVPFLGGDYFLFFSPVFNIADSSIFLGVLFILIYQKRYFNPVEFEKDTITDEEVDAENESEVVTEAIEATESPNDLISEEENSEGLKEDKP